MNLTLDQQALILTCAILVSLIGITGVAATQQWYADWVLTHTPLQKFQGTTNTNQALIARLPHAHLFGAAITKMDAVPVTNLQFEVTGIVKIGDEQDLRSKAYISVNGQPSKIYHIGDVLPYGVKVYSITPETVILSKDEHLEKIALSRGKLKFKP